MRWVAAISLTMNVVLGVVLGTLAVRRWVARAAPGPNAYQRARAEHLSALAPQGSVRAADVVVVGDSLVDWAEWHELLGRPAANRGVAGDRVADVAARLTGALAGSPRVVVVAVGVNDLFAGAAADVAADHLRLLASARALRPGARVVTVGILPVNDGLLARSGQRPRAGEVQEANRGIAAGAAAAGAQWLDLAPHLALSDGQLDPRLTPDGVHLGAEGYRRWAAAIRPYLD